MAQHAPFTKEQIKSANQVNLIEFAKSHGYVLDNGGRRAYHAKQAAVYISLRIAIVFCLDNDANATYSNGSPAPN
ncbi:hypothetical protein [Paenibacillus popilliae]|uniref:Uncharacterized protein n=1 Tax=Paenibacillus popilliae ATCC 14706 TaxID=1212764 RepID=M9LF31_PAEPP|nr:hypothetical protein [Paenibacillus popilliae]GAC40810.1 hypothetical protein PPOP_0137 [Paenibacillus popilliae ATCC 14706]